VVTASSSRLKACSARIGVVNGKIELKANPPARFKVGSWPPDNVTIYATVKVGDEIMKSYAQPMNLIVTGQPGGIQTNFQTNSRKGIATFSVAYKAPPEYVFKVTGPGLEPAQITIY